MSPRFSGNNERSARDGRDQSEPIALPSDWDNWLYGGRAADCLGEPEVDRITISLSRGGYPSPFTNSRELLSYLETERNRCRDVEKEARRKKKSKGG